ncbi:MAG: hypothetical protein COB69_01295, partial [Phycisphaera sp.]
MRPRIGQYKDGQEPGGLDLDARTGHLALGVRAFERTLEIAVDPEAGPTTSGISCMLSFAYLLEHGADDAGQVDWMPEPGEKSRAAGEILKRFKYGWVNVGVEEATAFVGGTRATRNAVVGFAFENRDTAKPELRDYVDGLLTEHWLDTAMDMYLKVFDRSFAHDLDREMYHDSTHPFQQMISYEAGKGFLRLAARLEYPDVDRDEIDRVNDAMLQLETKDWGGGYITPIIFSLNKPASLESLLAPEITVSFDLDGTGRDQAWPWVSPETAILVWDPEESGEITSGRQLFG